MYCIGVVLCVVVYVSVDVYSGYQMQMCMKIVMSVAIVTWYNRFVYGINRICKLVYNNGVVYESGLQSWVMMAILVILGTGVQLHSSDSHLESRLNLVEDFGSTGFEGCTIGVGVIQCGSVLVVLYIVVGAVFIVCMVCGLYSMY